MKHDASGICTSDASSLNILRKKTTLQNLYLDMTPIAIVVLHKNDLKTIVRVLHAPNM